MLSKSCGHAEAVARGGAMLAGCGRAELAMRLMVAQIAQKSLAPVWRLGLAGALSWLAVCVSKLPASEAEDVS